MEPLKEAVEAWLHRVRAPILGYSLLAALAINWEPIWALTFSDIDVFSKFLYFDLKTDVFTLFAIPLGIGTLSAIASPWIGLVGAYFARKPTLLLRRLQQDVRVDQEIYQLSLQAKIEDAKAEEERAREGRKLAALMRTQEAEKLGPEAVETLKRLRDASTTAENDPEIALSELDMFAIRLLGALGEVYVEDLSKKEEVLSRYQKIVPHGTPRRLTTELTDSLKHIEGLGLVQREGHAWSLKSKGYTEYDRLLSYL